MGCCDKNNNDNRNIKNRDVPQGVEPCCSVPGQRCMCLPYDDPSMITAQVVAVVVVFFSWVWWVTFIVSIMGMTLIQILWCCRQRRSMVSVSAVVAMICSLAEYAVGIYLLVNFKEYRYCGSFTLYHYGELRDRDDVDDDFYYDDYYFSDHCEEEKWAIVAFVSGTLWAIVTGCIIYFIASGRHAKWEGKYSDTGAETNTSNDTNNAAVELGRVPEATASDLQSGVVTAIAVAENDKHDV